MAAAPGAPAGRWLYTFATSHPVRYLGVVVSRMARVDAATVARQAASKQHVLDLFGRMARAGNGKIVTTTEGDYLDHPAGGCRMGTDPATSVCDSFGRTHDHENLYVVGAPTLP